MIDALAMQATRADLTNIYNQFGAIQKHTEISEHERLAMGHTLTQMHS